MTAQITFSPKPPKRGGQLTICVTGMTLPVTLSLDWDPAGTPTSVTIDKTGCATITVPGNATSLIASGGGAVASTTVTP